MEIYETQAEIATRKNWLLSLVVITLVAFGTLVLLQGISIALVPFLFQVSMEDLMSLVAGNYDIPNGRMALLFTQGVGSGLGFWAATWIVVRFLEKADLNWTKQLSRVNGKNMALVTAMTVGGMLFNGLLMYWNSHLVLPEFLSGVEQWMRDMETQLMELTQFLTDFQSIPELLTGILVIGVFAGVGIFSAIHAQFFGFLPRVFLGALFGYLYHYTGSLFYPILGHILNNALTLLLVYSANQGFIDLDVQATDTVSYPGAIVGFLVLILGFLYFKKVNRGKDEKLDQSV
ncbi:MAG: CPBP family intramembrane metalloprotease [Algoriphagus sp.]|nr:CPBP family intramembrane metalloprotease [Algoriphagus sp.]